MKLHELKSSIQEHLYMEDTSIIDVILATVITNLFKLSQPVWVIVIGPPSGGKTQFILPLKHAQPKGKDIIHEITDLTPNTFLSGFKTKEGEVSLLKRIGSEGILLFPDLTSLFSKDESTLHEILGQLRHVYDGTLTKHMGNQAPLSWEGRLGIVGASTPSIYRHFEQIADMGERFMYFRIRPYNTDKATQKSLSRALYGKDLDAHIGSLYKGYLGNVAAHYTGTTPTLQPDVLRAIKDMSLYASLFRAPVHVNIRTGKVDRIPDPEMPMRTALQLKSLALGLLVMNHAEGINSLTQENVNLLEWCAYSLANDERRNTLRALAQYPEGARTSGIAMSMNLPTESASLYLQQLNALNICTRSKEGGPQDVWQMTDENMRRFVLRVEGVGETTKGILSNEDDSWEQPEGYE